MKLIFHIVLFALMVPITPVVASEHRDTASPKNWASSSEQTSADQTPGRQIPSDQKKETSSIGWANEAGLTLGSAEMLPIYVSRGEYGEVVFSDENSSGSQQLDIEQIMPSVDAQQAQAESAQRIVEMLDVAESLASTRVQRERSRSSLRAERARRAENSSSLVSQNSYSETAEPARYDYPQANRYYRPYHRPYYRPYEAPQYRPRTGLGTRSRERSRAAPRRAEAERPTQSKAFVLPRG